MGDGHRDFDDRIAKLRVKHGKLSRGYSASVSNDGLVVLRPKNAARRFSLRGVALILLIAFGFKGFLIAYLGPETYAERIAQLDEGTFVEQAGAFVMQPDPGSEWIAAQLGPVLRAY